jgi:hypothetical protein
VFFVNLALGISIFLLLTIVLVVISRLNILSYQLERIDTTIENADKKFESVAKRLNQAENRQN